MHDYPTLRKAPIVHAFISCETDSSHTLDELKGISESLQSLFPIIEPYQEQIPKLVVNSQNEKISFDPETKGFLLFNEGRTLEVNLLMNGLKFRQSNRYSNWEELRHQYEKLWKVFSYKSPKMLNRIGVRFLNSFKMTTEEIRENLRVSRRLTRSVGHVGR